MPEELSPSQAARRIGSTTRSVQRWIARGVLPARRVGGRWRVAFDALDAFERGAARSEQPDRAIRRLFVANRGEIARRIQRTGDRLGIGVVVPPTDGPNAVDLLDIEVVVEAARGARADAVHPGFGFLAENADFAEAVIGAGITWIGPPPTAIRSMGDKVAARRLAVGLGIPVVPGYDGRGQSDAALRRAAEAIGYPLLVKPAGGGGGKGMRTVRTPERLADALAAARREATAAFGDARLLLERLVEGPRHVEVQVLFDRHGAGIHLGERDCSTQRRHQKVVEETPSPAVTAKARDQLTAHALRLAAAVGYESAGTVEFLLGARGEIFFLEMNTRLQVEHPVTELVSGLDLVEEQIRIAEGTPLRTDQATVNAALASGGHAIEVRLYAEDAEDGFLPATGRVERLDWPIGDGIRVDAGVDAGDEVSARFDPMLAKVVAHGADREAAIARLAAALDRTVVLGLTTNLRFLRWLLREPALRDGQMRIDSLERIWPPDDWSERTRLPDVAWQAAGRRLVGESWGGGWRLNGPPRIRLAAGDEERTVELAASGATAGEPLLAITADTVHVDVHGRSVPVRLAPAPDVDRAARSAAHAHHEGGSVEVAAPMPGAVLAVHRAAGEDVEGGDPIATLEAMKMEHAVVAPLAGRLAELAVRAGEQVARGQLIAVIEP